MLRVLSRVWVFSTDLGTEHDRPGGQGTAGEPRNKAVVRCLLEVSCGTQVAFVPRRPTEEIGLTKQCKGPASWQDRMPRATMGVGRSHAGPAYDDDAKVSDYTGATIDDEFTSAGAAEDSVDETRPCCQAGGRDRAEPNEPSECPPSSASPGDGEELDRIDRVRDCDSDGGSPTGCAGCDWVRWARSRRRPSASQRVSLGL